jgi:hypothetical protein
MKTTEMDYQELGIEDLQEINGGIFGVAIAYALEVATEIALIASLTGSLENGSYCTVHK